MANDEGSLTKDDNLKINTIASYVCQAIISIQEQQPEFLYEKYRNVQWNRYSLQSQIAVVLSQSQDWDSLMKKLDVCLKSCLIPESSNSPILIDLYNKVHHIQIKQEYLDSKNNFKYLESSETFIPTSEIISPKQMGIAILLLDAENLKINHETEKFLTELSNFPLQVKIAFANWRSMGKLDFELHSRGYDLIHVPAGKDHADGKMIAFGSSIHERYPNVKAVFVCSSDTVMTTLCNHIQQNGLIVYQVSQQGETVRVFNISTGETNTIIPILPDEIGTIEKFIQQLKVLIKLEQKQSQSFWIQLSKLSTVFKDKYKLTLSQVVPRYLPGKKARDIFINYPADFVIHQIDANSELYVTLLEVNQAQLANKKSESLSSSIHSRNDLEKALKNLIENLTNKNSTNFVKTNILAQEFKNKYNKSINEQIKDLQIIGNFITFLQSSSSFTLKQTGKEWDVTVS
ncbi:hypothetical protein NIES22_19160 [Calothrix brevissima NIES-22]|nr:hypothetical protein NIES22_19160 [Calothrix brevissima NIES-22]